MAEQEQERASIDGQKLKLEAEKKKFAAARKYKDAGKCQAELKELAARQEFLDDQAAKTQQHRQQIAKDVQGFEEQSQ